MGYLPHLEAGVQVLRVDSSNHDLKVSIMRVSAEELTDTYN